MLVLSSMLAGYLVLLQDSIMRKIESEHLIQRAVSFIGRLLDLIYSIGTNDKFLLCFLLLILLGFPLPNVFLSPSGGLHLESIDLQPAKNLARHGVYATLTTRGFENETYKYPIKWARIKLYPYS